MNYSFIKYIFFITTIFAKCLFLKRISKQDAFTRCLLRVAIKSHQDFTCEKKTRNKTVLDNVKARKNMHRGCICMHACCRQSKYRRGADSLRR